MEKSRRKIQSILQRLMKVTGQDLIEYALLCAMLSLAAVASMKTLATDISTSFTSSATTLTTYAGGGGNQGAGNQGGGDQGGGDQGGGGKGGGGKGGY